MEERAAIVARRAVRVQVVRSAEDRVVRVVDVAAESVRPPRRRHELHRALCAGGAVVAQLVECALDEIDRCEHVPPHAEAALTLPVVTDQRGGRQRPARAKAPAPRDRGQPPELALRVQVRPDDAGRARWNAA